MIKVWRLQSGALLALLLLSMDAYPSWIGFGRLAFGAILLLAPIIFLLDVRDRPIPRQQFYVAVVMLVAYSILLLPYRTHDQLLANIVFPPVIFVSCLLTARVYVQAFSWLSTIVALSGLSSLGVFLANLVGIDLPYLTLSQNFRSNQADYYKVYGFSVQLSTQSWSIGGGSIVRTSGILKEPGHFGLLCSLLLVVMNFDFRSSVGKFVLIAGMLTLSPAFYGFLMVYLILRYGFTRIGLLKLIVFAAVLAFVFVLVGNMSSDYAINRLLGPFYAIFSQQDIEGVLDARAADSMVDLFNRIEFSRLIFGMGSGFSEAYGIYGGAISDWRGAMMRNGIVTVAALSIAYLAPLAIRPSRIAILIALYFIMVMSHRSGMVVSIWMPVIAVGGWLSSRMNEDGRVRCAGITVAQRDLSG